MHHVIIVPNHDSFQWSLAIELALHMASNNQAVSVYSCEIVNPFKPKELVAAIFKYNSLNSKIVKELREKNIDYFVYRKYILKKVTMNILDPQGQIQMTNRLIRLAAPNVADTLRISLLTPSLKVIESFKYYIKQINGLIQLLDKIQKRLEVTNSRIYTVNGRYALNKCVKEYFTELGAEVKILETGKGDSFTLWNNAQSMAELSAKAREMWLVAPSPEKEFIANSHMSRRVIPGLGDNSAFTRKMESGIIGNSLPKKKICTFFSTSQIEFLYLEDRIPANHFQSQLEAFEILLSTLSEDWHLILRRHPHGNGNDFGDDEGSMWERFSQNDRVTIIEPNSNVNSYELAGLSDLTAHFGSSIGADLIYINKTPVISMGPTEWDSSESVTQVRDVQTLRKYLSRDFKKEKRELIFPWAYFYEKRGKAFSFLEKDPEGDYCLSGSKLIVSRKARVKQMLDLPLQLQAQMRGGFGK